MKRRTLAFIAFAIASLACAAARSESQRAMFAASSAPLVKPLTPEQREEWRFLKVASAGGRFELDAARLALSRSNDAHVRALAATLVEQHTSAQLRLQQMLGERNMAPAMLSNEQRKALNRLSKLHGAKFDRSWIESVALRSQQERVAVYEKAAQSAGDPVLRGWAEEQLPVLREQLQAAQRFSGGRPAAVKFTARSTP